MSGPEKILTRPDQGLTPQKRGFGEFERSIYQAKAGGAARRDQGRFGLAA
jgi:hypothetical protein